jgi:hypothetical protein
MVASTVSVNASHGMVRTPERNAPRKLNILVSREQMLPTATGAATRVMVPKNAEVGDL